MERGFRDGHWTRETDDLMTLLETAPVPKAPTEVLQEVVYVCLEWVGEWEGGTGQLEETDLPEASAKQSWKMGQEKEEEVGAGDIFSPAAVGMCREGAKTAGCEAQGKAAVSDIC